MNKGSLVSERKSQFKDQLWQMVSCLLITLDGRLIELQFQTRPHALRFKAWQTKVCLRSEGGRKI